MGALPAGRAEAFASSKWYAGTCAHDFNLEIDVHSYRQCHWLRHSAHPRAAVLCNSRDVAGAAHRINVSATAAVTSSDMATEKEKRQAIEYLIVMINQYPAP